MPPFDFGTMGNLQALLFLLLCHFFVTIKCLLILDLIIQVVICNKWSIVRGFSHIYQYVNSSKTRLDAQHYCKETYNGSLYSQDNLDLNRFKILDLPQSGKVWTKRYSVLSHWMENIGCFGNISSYINGSAIRFEKNSASVCQVHCNSSNFFATNGKDCICLKNNILLGSQKLTDTSHQVPCLTSNSYEKRGGQNVYKVYKKLNFKNDTTAPDTKCVAINCTSKVSTSGPTFYARHCTERHGAVCTVPTRNETAMLNWTDASDFCYIHNGTLLLDSDNVCKYTKSGDLFWTGIYREYASIDTDHKQGNQCVVTAIFNGSFAGHKPSECNKTFGFICEYDLWMTPSQDFQVSSFSIISTLNKSFYKPTPTESYMNHASSPKLLSTWYIEQQASELEYSYLISHSHASGLGVDHHLKESLSHLNQMPLPTTTLEDKQMVITTVHNHLFTSQGGVNLTNIIEINTVKTISLTQEVLSTFRTHHVASQTDVASSNEVNAVKTLSPTPGILSSLQTHHVTSETNVASSNETNAVKTLSPTPGISSSLQTHHVTSETNVASSNEINSVKTLSPTPGIPSSIQTHHVTSQTNVAPSNEVNTVKILSPTPAIPSSLQTHHVTSQTNVAPSNEVNTVKTLSPTPGIPSSLQTHHVTSQTNVASSNEINTVKTLSPTPVILSSLQTHHVASQTNVASSNEINTVKTLSPTPGILSSTQTYHVTSQTNVASSNELNTVKTLSATPGILSSTQTYHVASQTNVASSNELNTVKTLSPTPGILSSSQTHHVTSQTNAASSNELNTVKTLSPTPGIPTTLQTHHVKGQTNVASSNEVNTVKTLSQTPGILSSLQTHHVTSETNVASSNEVNTVKTSSPTPGILSSLQTHHVTSQTDVASSNELNTVKTLSPTQGIPTNLQTHHVTIQTNVASSNELNTVKTLSPTQGIPTTLQTHHVTGQTNVASSNEINTVKTLSPTPGILSTLQSHHVTTQTNVASSDELNTVKTLSPTPGIPTTLQTHHVTSQTDAASSNGMDTVKIPSQRSISSSNEIHMNVIKTILPTPTYILTSYPKQETAFNKSETVSLLPSTSNILSIAKTSENSVSLPAKFSSIDSMFDETSIKPSYTIMRSDILTFENTMSTYSKYMNPGTPTSASQISKLEAITSFAIQSPAASTTSFQQTSIYFGTLETSTTDSPKHKPSIPANTVFSNEKEGSSPTGIIAGVCGTVGLGIAVLVTVVIWKKRRNRISSLRISPNKENLESEVDVMVQLQE